MSQGKTPRASSCTLITGADGELGRAFAVALARQRGSYVVLADRGLAAAHQTLQAIEATEAHGEAVQLDVTNPLAWRELIERLRGQHTQLDMLINCAGVASGGEVHDCSPEEFQRVMQVNYFGTLYGCQAVVPWMKSTGSGHIVNVASITGYLSPPATAAYASSKAAVIALSESLYAELLPHKIGVTVSVPGFFSSALIEQGLFTEDSIRQRAQSYADRARLTSSEVAETTLGAVKQGRLYAVAGSRARWYWRLKRLAPQWLAKKLSKKFATID